MNEWRDNRNVGFDGWLELYLMQIGGDITVAHCPPDYPDINSTVSADGVTFSKIERVAI